jgi:hypothetical protein
MHTLSKVRSGPSIRSELTVARAVSWPLQARNQIGRSAIPDGNNWLDHELSGCRFKDARLSKRLRKLIEQTEDAVGESIPHACEDWANTKAAYRLFANPRVTEDDILGGHFQATARRVAERTEPVLVLHDTTEFSFHRGNPDAIGFTRVMHRGRQRTERDDHRKICGVLMHSALVVTTDGLPLGLAAGKFWTRKTFKSLPPRQRGKLQRTPIAEKESARWPSNLRIASERLGPERCIHVGDREGDIYEFLCAAAEVGTHVLVRSHVDRWAGEGDHKIGDEMAEAGVRGLYRIEVPDERGKTRQATLEIKYRRVRVRPPKRQTHLPTLMLTVIHAVERDPPKRGIKKIEWKLITDLPVGSRDEAIEKLRWYAMRWKIEVFHKVLKSGCKIEEAKLQTVERLVNMIAVYCILSWRIFWMTMVNRASPDAPPSVAFTVLEMRLLEHLVPDRSTTPLKRTLARYIIKTAQLAGYLARANDPPPGNKLMWKGLTRLTDIALGALARDRIMGK